MRKVVNVSRFRVQGSGFPGGILSSIGSALRNSTGRARFKVKKIDTPTRLNLSVTFGPDNNLTKFKLILKILDIKQLFTNSENAEFTVFSVVNCILLVKTTILKTKILIGASRNLKRQNIENERLSQSGQIMDTRCLMLDKKGNYL